MNYDLPTSVEIGGESYASRAIGVCREPNSIAAAMFLENSGVPASCSYDY